MNDDYEAVSVLDSDQLLVLLKEALRARGLKTERIDLISNEFYQEGSPQRITARVTVKMPSRLPIQEQWDGEK